MFLIRSSKYVLQLTTNKISIYIYIYISFSQIKSDSLDLKLINLLKSNISKNYNLT